MLSSLTEDIRTRHSMKKHSCDGRITFIRISFRFLVIPLEGNHQLYAFEVCLQGWRGSFWSFIGRAWEHKTRNLTLVRFALDVQGIVLNIKKNEIKKKKEKKTGSNRLWKGRRTCDIKKKLALVLPHWFWSFVYERSIMNAAMLNHWTAFQNLVPTLPTMQRTTTHSFKLLTFLLFRLNFQFLSQNSAYALLG